MDNSNSTSTPESNSNPESNRAPNPTSRPVPASQSESVSSERQQGSSSTSDSTIRPEPATRSEGVASDRQQGRAVQLQQMELALQATNADLESLLHVLDTLRQAPELEARAMLAELRSCDNIQDFARAMRRRGLVSTSTGRTVACALKLSFVSLVTHMLTRSPIITRPTA